MVQTWSRMFKTLVALVAGLVGAAVGARICGIAQAAEPYPARPIQMIVPYGAGGASDVGSRIMAERMSGFLKQPIVSVYKPGGGGTLATSLVAKARPDGYTMTICDMNTVGVVTITKKPGYTLKDFELVGAYLTAPVMFVVRSDSKWKTLKEFTDDAKQAPGKLTVANYGKLTTPDFVVHIYTHEAGIKLTSIPFKSSAEAITELLGGHVDAALVVTTGGLRAADKVRVLAITGEERVTGLPGVPTFSELGYEGIPATYHSFCFPKGTPAYVLKTMYRAEEQAFKVYGQQIKEAMMKAELYAVLVPPRKTTEIYEAQVRALRKAAREVFGMSEK